MLKNLLLFTMLFCSTTFLFAQDPPELSSWIQSDGTTTGKYYLSNGTIIDTGVEADVQEVWYTDENVYILATGIPSYLMGPFSDGNPGVPDDQNWFFSITRNPTPETGNLVETPLGAIGVLTNGTLFENYSDARSYNNQGVWNQNANFFELDGFDCVRGHPQGTAYHHHQHPAAFDVITNPESDICDQYPSTGLYTPNANEHSPIIGYAFDGYPLYGPYAYANTDGTGGIKRMESSYALASYSVRTHLPDGTDVTDGPPVNATYPLGAYKEDYYYVAGLGDLDEHNGRFCITPEYPNGTYAYFTTLYENGYSQYPFFIGPTYYGVVDQCNYTIGFTSDESTTSLMGPPVVDCDAIPAPPPGAPCCGDGICNGSEDANSCPDDCDGNGGGGCETTVPDEAILYVPTTATCDDGVQNGDETGIDCGGTTCSPCVTCDFPSGIYATVISGNVAKINWDTQADVDKFRVRYRIVGGTWTQVTTAIDENYRFLNQLTPNTNYEYQVKTNCSSGENSVWSATLTFTTLSDLCDYPESSATNSITATSATADWPENTDDLKWKIKYKAKVAGTSWTEVIINQSTYTMTGLSAGTNYKYKLKTKCAASWTNWGAKYEFSTPATAFGINGAAENNALSERQVQLSPNPARDELNLNFRGITASVIRINTINGQVVEQYTSAEAVNAIDISTLQSGIYFLTVITDKNEVITARFVKN